MAKITRGANGVGYRDARKGDVRSLVHIDNPDDAEFARPLGEGDAESLVTIDNPDDAHVYDTDNTSNNSPIAANKEKQNLPVNRSRRNPQ